MHNGNINITTTGGSVEQRELVTNVITRAMVDEGFANVALVNTKGEPMVGSNVPSLMEHIRQNHPDFMQTPIRVWSTPNIVSFDDFLDEFNDNDEGERIHVSKETEKGYGLTSIMIEEGERPKEEPRNPQHDKEFERLQTASRWACDKAVISEFLEKSNAHLSEGDNLKNFLEGKYLHVGQTTAGEVIDTYANNSVQAADKEADRDTHMAQTEVDYEPTNEG